MGYKQVLASHRGWDPGALHAARRLARDLDAPLLAAQTSRLLIDLNRSPGHPHLFSEVTAALSPAERQEIFDAVHAPHWRQAREALAQAIAEKGAVLHLAIHSFTPRYGAVVRQADIGLLYDPSRPRERRLCRQWGVAIGDRAPDLRVRRNYPYRGVSDGLARAMRRLWPDAQYAGVEVELNHGPWFEDKPRWNRMVKALIAALPEM